MTKLVGVGVVVFLALAAALDVTSVDLSRPEPVPVLSAVVAVPALLVLLVRRRLPHHRLVAAGLVLAVASLLLTVAGPRVATAVGEGAWGVTECALLVLLLEALVRRWTGHVDTGVVCLLAAAVVVAPWRVYSDAVSLSLLSGLGVLAVLMVGVLRRIDDVAHARRLRQVRDDERRDIARDLHDDVAQHVTEIAVTAQAAAVAAEADPAVARAALGAIEHAAVDALEAMRSLVSVMRVPGRGDAGQEDTGPRTVARWPGDLAAMVDRFGGESGLTTSVTIGSDPLPPAHQQAARRVVQESLTNIRKHAVGATRVDVSVGVEGEALRIRVTDDGRTRRGSTGPLARSGGGFGLVGVRERATALGGSVAAGHRPQGGWRVDVVLPLGVRSVLSG